MVHRSSLLAPMTLALFVMAGFQIVWLVGLSLGEQTLQSLLSGGGQQVLVDPSGQLVIVRYVDGEPRYSATDGKPLDPPDDNYWLSGASLSAPLGEKERNRWLTWPERLSSVTVGGRSPIVWFLVHSPVAEGDAYLVGYNVFNNAEVGYLDRAGFRTTLPPRDQWFPVDGSSRINFGYQAVTWQEASGTSDFSTAVSRRDAKYLASGGQVWRIDLAERKVRPLFTSDHVVSVSTSPIVSLAPADKVPEDWSGGPFYVLSGARLLVRTPTVVIGANFEGRTRTRWTIPEELRGRDLTWYELTDGTALLAEIRIDEDTNWTEYYWIDEQGNITRHEEVRVAPKPPASQKYWMMAAVVPQSFSMTLMSNVALPIGAVDRGFQPDYPTALAKSLADGWTAILAVCLISAALACLAYRRQTRFALSGPVAWAFFVFLFGFPGWLAYRWHRRWPVLEPCGECHRAAPRDRDTCAACGHLFAPPGLVGTEVFA